MTDALSASKLLSMAATPTYRLADSLLEGKLREFVLSRRARSVSWRGIAKDLKVAVDVDVSFEALRLWFSDEDLSEFEVDGSAVLAVPVAEDAESVA